MLGLDPGKGSAPHRRTLLPRKGSLVCVLELGLVRGPPLEGMWLISPHDYELEFIISWWIVH